MIRNGKEVIARTAAALTEQCSEESLFVNQDIRHLPNRKEIIDMLEEIRRVLFPGYYGDENITATLPEFFIGNALTHIYNVMYEQVDAALSYKCNGTAQCAWGRTEEVCDKFFERLPYIQKMLLKDVQAAFEGDPAAKSKEEIIFSYPGLYAICVYRIAHELYKLQVPFIPRIMTEHAHGKTGIDINSGATIGEYFFIDHGTGVVIGETTTIGDHVKIYQGVTLGALSTRKGQQLAGVKRHPTIEDNVTIYSGSTILGGDTVIGKDSVIGGNAFIVESIAEGTKVSVKTPELTFKVTKRVEDEKSVWE